VCLARRIAAHPPELQDRPVFQHLLGKMEDLADAWPWWTVRS
jgi:hypothetical protein